jgi:hypothetical protein
MDFAQWIIAVTPPTFFPAKGESIGAKAPAHPDVVIETKRVWEGRVYPLTPTPTSEVKTGFC